MHHEGYDDRAFWRTTMLHGGQTGLPRWTLEPIAGTAVHEVAVPDDLDAALHRVAEELGVPLASLLLALHAKVLSALTGEHEVVTGYQVAPDRPPLPCVLTTEPLTWRQLVLAAHDVESRLLRHQHFAVDELRRDLGVAGPSGETVFDPTGTTEAGLGAGTAVRVAVTRRGGSLVLVSTYRTDVLDADAAARLAGYHLAASALLVADPEADHRLHSLVSEEELRFQLDGLAGPHRELPDRRFHELFEERVRLHPDAVAAVLGDRRWTYRELNGRANRIARALLGRGLRREGVVAVVTERNLDWMACVLAVLKAGGVYLPVEPHFPADRIATTLARAECGLVLTERGSTATLDRALESLPVAHTLHVDRAYGEDWSERDLGIPVTEDQLAYIYFTSGSTGEPKGAMCEHAGMLNHLLAKIEDLGIGESDVVAQTAPQCFDISLWQLVAALLVGGRTLIVEQDVILDVERFVDTLAGGDVAVAQVVPSYLEVVLSYLEQRFRRLPSLRCVSVTGEAVKQELAQRWFATQPDVTLVNAYGLTETSDDTNHEVLDRAPAGDVVPLGRPVNNVRVYVVDEQLSPVPLGAPGLIVFSGVCVGRGYVNDPERTALAYLTDPHRPGERLYRGGDYGRWQPDGKLVFLGRKDSQVKIAGFRIEIGEIENTLLRVPGVRDGAVVVAERSDGGKQLVAFYGGPHPLDVELLRERLGGSLPSYMVPAAFHWQQSLPLTANGKIDRSALTARVSAPDDPGAADQTPTTPSERRLAAAWAQVLGVGEDTIGRHDHFFDLGGSSLSAVKLAIAMERAVTLKDVTRHPVLVDLAQVLDGRTAPHEALLHLVTTDDILNEEEITMPSMPTASMTSELDLDLEPGHPPLLRLDGTGDASRWVATHRDALLATVLEHGSVLVRGLGLRDADECGDVFRSLADLMPEREAFAPREAYSQHVYSSTKWPPNQPMCMHHELSYTVQVPRLMLFACLQSPTAGGATAVSDSSRVLEALPGPMVERFEREGWLLVRNYNDEIGASWEEAFGTEDRADVEAYGRANAIMVEWQPDGGLRTRQRRSAVLRHPVTGRRSWFNQIAFLNEWTLDPEIREYLVEMYGADGLPFTTCYGNGEPIGEQVVATLNEVYEAHTVREPWQAGDLMLVDNISTAHSREAFEGPREVVVALAEPVAVADCAPTVETTAS